MIVFHFQYDESTVIEAEPDSEIQPHLPSPTSPSDEAEIVIGRDDDISEREIRRIQDKWRDILQDETDWPGHQYQYDIVVSTNCSFSNDVTVIEDRIKYLRQTLHE